MDKAIIQIQQNIESIKRISSDESPIEFWSARDLMPMLGYIKWQKFLEVIRKVKESCKTGGQSVSDHFTGAGKMVLTGNQKIKIKL